MANIDALLPRTRLVFRPADALRLDLVTTISLLSALATVKFTSYSAFRVTIVAVLLALLRSLFGYGNALARYQLLQNSFQLNTLSAAGVDAVGRYVHREAATQRARAAEMLLMWLRTRPDDRAPPTVDQLLTERYEMLRADGDNAPPPPGGHATVDVRAAAAELLRLGLAREGREGRLVPVGSDEQAAVAEAYIAALMRRTT